MELRKALFIRFGGLGDILLATPTLRSLAKKYPGVEIDFIVGGGMAPVLAGDPLVRNVLCFDKRGTDSRIDRFVPFLWNLRKQNYDIVVNLHPSAKSYLMAWASRAKTCLTFTKHMGVNQSTGQVTHAIDDFAKTLQSIDVTLDNHSLDFEIPLSAKLRLRQILVEHGIDDHTHLLVINPAASRPLNRWPLERFQQVAAHFAKQKNTTVILTGAPPTFRTVMDSIDEAALAQQVACSDTRIINLAGRLSIKEFGALLERADIFLTCDTGPMHIGAALHTPMVVLSGAADPNRTGPLTDNSVVIIDRNLPCVPCRDRVCARHDVKCMDNISVNQVIDKISSMLYHDSPLGGMQTTYPLPIMVSTARTSPQ